MMPTGTAAASGAPALADRCRTVKCRAGRPQGERVKGRAVGGSRSRALTRPLRDDGDGEGRSEEHTSELQSLMRISYAVFCLKKKRKKNQMRKEHQDMKKKA